jgi:hypothetical protein
MDQTSPFHLAGRKKVPPPDFGRSWRGRRAYGEARQRKWRCGAKNADNFLASAQSGCLNARSGIRENSASDDELLLRRKSHDFRYGLGFWRSSATLFSPAVKNLKPAAAGSCDKRRELITSSPGFRAWW